MCRLCVDSAPPLVRPWKPVAWTLVHLRAGLTNALCHLHAPCGAPLQTCRAPRAAMFERRRAYEVPVWMSRHPELNEYIAQALANARPLLVECLLHRVYLCFKRENGAIEESFVFELQESGDAPAGPITLDVITEVSAQCSVTTQLQLLVPNGEQNVHVRAVFAAPGMARRWRRS
eukprot:TRINITY_DN64_c3_g1_i2.p2 TRINITY_DN64_c3_g1~~TRINITY_DN64_c3_g1_i2.p2  ORF type:complete len:175 (+),score=32.34 TRINITY_DN64_c3_g1_i2:1014-1538(+)